MIIIIIDLKIALISIYYLICFVTIVIFIFDELDF